MIFFLLPFCMGNFPYHISIESVSHVHVAVIKIIPKFVKDALKPPKRGIHIIFFLFLHKNLMGIQKHLLQMNISHNGCFQGEIRKISVLFG